MEKNLFKWLLFGYYAFCVATSFYFSQYDLFVEGISIADVMLISSCFMCLLYTRKLKIQDSALLVLCYVVGIVLFALTISISGLDFPLVPGWKVLSRLIRYGTYAILILLVTDNSPFQHCKKNKILTIYKFFCYCFSIYAILQAVIYLTTHYMLPANILPIPWSREIDTASILSNAQNYYFRGFGPFQEPSYLAKFILPGLAFSLFGWPQNKSIKSDWKLSLIILGTIFVSTSVQGILISSVTIFLYCFNYKQKIPLVGKLLFLLVIVTMGIIFLSSDILSVASERMLALFRGQDYGYSNGLRLFRGFAFWYKMPFIFKIIGTGLGNMANFAFVYDIFTKFDYTLRDPNFLEYGSGLSLILVQSGIVGFLLTLLWFYNVLKHLNSTGKIILMQFFCALISGGSIFSVLTVFYCSLIFINRRKI